MKTIYLIGGTMGVGKTTVSQQLKKELPKSVFPTWEGPVIMITIFTSSNKNLLLSPNFFNKARTDNYHHNS